MIADTVLSYLQLTKNAKSIDTQLTKLEVKFDKRKAEDFQQSKRAIYQLYYSDIIDADTRLSLLKKLRASIISHVENSNK